MPRPIERKWTKEDKELLLRTLGTHLRDKRFQLQLTNSEAANYLGLYRATYKRYEEGKGLPNLLTLYKLYWLFDLDMEAIFQEVPIKTRVMCKECMGKGYVEVKR